MRSTKYDSDEIWLSCGIEHLLRQTIRLTQKDKIVWYTPEGMRRQVLYLSCFNMSKGETGVMYFERIVTHFETFLVWGVGMPAWRRMIMARELVADSYETPETIENLWSEINMQLSRLRWKYGPGSLPEFKNDEAVEDLSQELDSLISGLDVEQ